MSRWNDEEPRADIESALREAVIEERKALREIIQTVAVLWFRRGGENRPQSALIDEIFAALDAREKE